MISSASRASISGNCLNLSTMSSKAMFAPTPAFQLEPGFQGRHSGLRERLTCQRGEIARQLVCFRALDRFTNAWIEMSTKDCRSVDAPSVEIGQAVRGRDVDAKSTHGNHPDPKEHTHEQGFHDRHDHVSGRQGR